MDAPDLFADLDIQPADIPIPPESKPDTGSGDLRCEVCGIDLEYSGRGRKPRLCPEHKKTRTNVNPSVGVVRRGARHEARLTALTSDLTNDLVVFGNGVSAMWPVTGTIMVGRAERTAIAMVKAAEGSDRALAALEMAAKVTPALEIAQTAVMLGVAIGVDTNRVKPDAMIAVMTGVAATWEDIYGNRPETVEHRGFPTVDVPPRFQTVG